MTDISLIRDFIKKRSGLSFTHQGDSLLENGVRQRMSDTHICSCDKYLECLTGNQEEFRRLISLLTVNETYFYRESAHLSLLTEAIIPELMSGRGAGGEIKIVSAGCATGEEPYSLAIALMEKYGTGIQTLCEITGGDIDDRVLEKAQQGVFCSLSFRSLSSTLKDKYFEPAENNSHRIRDIVREKVSFCRLNLFGDTYPREFHEADIIFYRNVSIYFSAETQREIFRKLSELLNDGGYLFMGSTETYSHNIGFLSLVERDGIFLYHKNRKSGTKDRRMRHTEIEGNTRRPAALPSSEGSPSANRRNLKTTGPKGAFVQAPGTPDKSPSGHPGRRKVSQVRSFEEALSLGKDKRHAEALAQIDRIPEPDPAFRKGQMLKAGLLINMQKVDEAERVCLKSLETDRWCLEAYLLLGLIAKMRNDEQSAVNRFKEALYIKSSCWLAHYYLGEIYASRGEPESACREYEIVVRILSREDISDHGLTFFPVSFSAEQLLHLCEHTITNLRKQLRTEAHRKATHGI